MNLRALMAVLPLLAWPVSAWAQHCHPELRKGVSTCGNKNMALPDKPMEGLGELTHPVSPKNKLAQKFFDQGLTLHYAFNNEQAILFFKKAAQLDPDLAMADWGIALAASTNINVTTDSECERMGMDAITTAQKKMKREGTSNSDRALIQALSTRYPQKEGQQDDLQLSAAYALAMAKVYKDYRDDPDVATLYADALMNLQPWRLWEEGKPVLGTEKIVKVLNDVLKRPKTQKHLGANHFYIHAVEASCTPGDAEESAQRLREAKLFSAGHLVHMPSHIAMRTGNFKLAAADNHQAVEEDLKAYGAACDNQDPAKCLPLYVGHYLNHNLYFELAANQQLGRLDESLALAKLTEQRTRQYVDDEPGLEHYMVSEIMTLARFRKWNTVLEVLSPEPKLLMAQTVWQWARAMAYAATPGNPPKVAAQRRFYLDAFDKVPSTLNWGNNKAIAYRPVMDYLLAAQVAEHSAPVDRDAAIELLKLAVKAEDNLIYDEPNAWPLTTRETLGGAYLRAGNFLDAEKVFKEDLSPCHNPENPRSLFGLWKSLEGQLNPQKENPQKEKEMQDAKRRFEKAWPRDDKSPVVELKVEDL
jgi:tetratricopeptide (TPR) repeat protein